MMGLLSPHETSDFPPFTPHPHLTHPMTEATAIHGHDIGAVEVHRRGADGDAVLAVEDLRHLRVERGGGERKDEREPGGLGWFSWGVVWLRSA